MNAAETRTLLAALDAALARGQRAAIATVVQVWGSAYRREGTRMLVLDDGAQVCMLSGGCLEAEVVEAALEVIASGEARVVHYDLTEDATWGLGLGCGGSVDVRIERVDPDDEVTRGWLTALRSGQAAALVQPLEGPGRLLLVPDAAGEVQVSGQLPGGTPPEVLTLAQARLAAREPRAARAELPDGQALFIDLNAPAPELLIYGAGHDAVPLSAQAVALGYQVTVVDARAAFLTPGRFPGARLQLLATDQLDALSVSPRTQAVIMNHHLDRDRECLWHALGSPAAYVGVLGPRSRTQGLLDTLEGEGHVCTPEQLERLHSPVGLGIGAEAPEEVALSILAELMAWRRGGSGRPLNGLEGRIHQPQMGEALTY
ncbi:XdhC/CoxI family protein [Deinococcus sonorensis]|uniref:XdhC/CoxI family protein n=2 Tax=Deinococcus sonorensis TaxID=309891 RepID=A0AAU7U9T9_9DEIO